MFTHLLYRLYIPTGVPTTVCPNDEKIDMATLQQDIPKFFPWISQTVVEEWESFMADLPNKVTESGDSGGWIMEEVFQLFNKQLLLPLPAIQCKTVYWLTCSQLSKLPARYKFYITTHTSTHTHSTEHTHTDTIKRTTQKL